MIKLIIFDNIGVFTKKGLGKTLDTFSSRFNIDREEIELEYKRLAKIANKGDMTANQLYQSLIDTFDLKASVSELRKVHLDSYGEDRNLEMYAYATELSKTFKICLFSNFSDAFDELNEKLKLEEVFGAENIIVSAKIKLKKPDREAFEYVLDRLGSKPNEAVFIDDREINLPPARELGMKTILFTSPTQCKNELSLLLEEQDGEK